MGNSVEHLGDFFVKDEHGEFHKVGEFGEKTVTFDMEIEDTVELEQSVPDGINIHITGSEINKIDNITIYLKEVM